MDKNITPKLRVIGTEQEIEKFEKLILPYNSFLTYSEPQVRNIIQKILDEKKVNLIILYEGNSVYSKIKILRVFKKFLKNYSIESFSNSLYEFFHLCCGSIAHYNKLGWFDSYPDVYSLKRFFTRNEYGETVLNHQPQWAIDRINIVKEMNKLLKTIK